MSLTDMAELAEMLKKPMREPNTSTFLGDGSDCNYRTGHCTNTGACDDCVVYLSEMKVREYESGFSGNGVVELSDED
jgi:hypothetical protein